MARSFGGKTAAMCCASAVGLLLSLVTHACVLTAARWDLPSACVASNGHVENPMQIAQEIERSTPGRPFLFDLQERNPSHASFL